MSLWIAYLWSFSMFSIWMFIQNCFVWFLYWLTILTSFLSYTLSIVPWVLFNILYLITVSCSVMLDSLQPHGLWTARLLCPWGFPGKNTRVGCHSLLWDLLEPGIKPWSLCIAGRFFTIWIIKRKRLQMGFHLLGLILLMLCLNAQQISSRNEC